MNERIWGIIGGVALLLALLSPLVLGNSKKVERLFEDAEVLYERSNHEGAIEKYKEALKESNKPGAKTEHIDKDFTTLANLRIALCYYHLAEKTQDVNYYHDALAYITKVWQNAYVAKHQEELIYLWAETLYKIEDFEQAKDKFARLIEKFPNSRRTAKALYTIGNINYQQQNYEEAKYTFQKLIGEFPHSEFKPEAEQRVVEIEQLFKVEPEPEQLVENEMRSKVSDESEPTPPQPEPEPELQVEVMYNDALYLTEQGKLHDAIQSYTDLITQFPENYQYVTDAYIGIAEIYLEAEDYVKAREHYEEAMYTTNDGNRKIEIYKKYQLTYLVPVYANDGNARDNSGDAQFFIQATRLRKEGKYLEAAKLYERLTNSNLSTEDNAKATYWAGYCYYKEGLTNPVLFDKSVSVFKRLISDYSESSYAIESYYGLVLVYSDWAQILSSESKWELVITTVDEAITKYTNSHDVRDRGWLSRMRERKEIAIQKLKPLLNPNPDIKPVPGSGPVSAPKPLTTKERHVDQGYIHFGRGELKNAAQKARQALKTDSNYQRAHELLLEIKETYYGRGWTFFDEEQYDKAIDAFKNAINIESQFKEAHCHLGVIYIKKKEYAAAIKSLKQAISIDQNFKEAHFNLSLAYLRLGRFEESRNAANAVLRIDPNYDPANRLIDYIAD